MTYLARSLYCASIIFIGFILLSILPPSLTNSSPPLLYAQTLPTLDFFTPVTGQLDAENLFSEWQFTGQVDAIISLTVETTSGNLDPVLELYDSAANLLFSNDNAAFDDTDPRLEAYILPSTAVYTVRVYREGMGYGLTSGEFRLTLLKGFSISQSDTLPTPTLNPNNAGGISQTLATIPTANFYLDATLTMPSLSDAYQATWRFHEGAIDSPTWIFQHNIKGDWRISIESQRRTVFRSSLNPAPEHLPLAGESADFLFYFHAQALDIWVNGQLLTSQTSTEAWTNGAEIRLDLNVPSMPDDELPINQLQLSTPYYAQDPTTTGAIPPTPAGERLYSYQYASMDIVNELRALDYIPQEGVGIQSAIQDAYIFIGAAGFRAYPLETRPFEDFALGYTATLTSGSPQTACGLIFRQIDAANFATTLFNPSRGLYFLEYRNGVPSENSQALFSDALLPDLNTKNYFVIVAKEGQGWLFVNGRLVASIPLRAGAGQILSHIVLDTDTPAYCQVDDLWLWSFD